MRFQQRHVIRQISGVIGAPGNSPEVTMHEACSALIYLNGVDTCEVTVEATPDGTLWLPLYDEDGTLVKFTLSGAADQVFPIKRLPKRFRLAIAVANLATGAWIEGLREIA